MSFDDRTKSTTSWAIAKAHSFAAVAAAVHFKLANRATATAHDLVFIGGGVTIGIEGKPGIGKPEYSYASFRTRKPVTFSKFDGCGARLTSITAKLGVGYSKTFLTIWPGAAYGDDPLAKITFGGWGVGKPALSGQAAVHGILKLSYGSGALNGRVNAILEIDTPIERIIPDVPVKTRAHEKLLAVPTDSLFDFDKYSLNPSATDALGKAAALIQLRDRGKVEIAGHTDSVGNANYNKQLSIRRAQAVKDWLVREGVYGAEHFQIVGHGEARPVAPNETPDGNDNPDGRAKNRRVEIIFRY